ncbi:MAG: hydroxyacylglutathione hydrolase, partial [Solirubrobacteraceae bacterium]|nr:hydroxyacylglutathione hydrolase [Solirubrobacteraceae bacterium]
MEQVADGLKRISLMPGDRLNSYVIGSVLIDSGTPQSHKKLLPQLSGIDAHALTHGHDDHYGSSKTICERLEIPFWAPDGDADEIATRRPVRPKTWFTPLMRLAKPSPAPPIARRLQEGDEVGGFTVLDAPGHSPGHVVYWRESDRTLVIGDVLFNCNLVT